MTDKKYVTYANNKRPHIVDRVLDKLWINLTVVWLDDDGVGQ